MSTQILKTDFTNNPFVSPKFCRQYPCSALEFIKQNPDLAKNNIFNSYAWGGYLVWNWPEKQIFIDGRFPQYPYAGHTFLEEYFEFYDPELTLDKMDQFNIGLALLPAQHPQTYRWYERLLFGYANNPSDADNEMDKTIYNILDDAADWELAYADDYSVVYHRLASE